MPLSTIDTSSISGLGYGFKNRIINGGMQIDQRNSGASIANVAGYTLDRWNANYLGSATGRLSAQQSTTAPSNFKNSILLTVTTADASPVSTAGYSVYQPIEGFNIADFGWGTATAQTVTVSFWVRSSVTGTFPLTIVAGASNRQYGATYTISSVNTFEYKTITIAGDTAGTWSTDNSAGLYLVFGLGGGSGRTLSAGWQTFTSSLGTNVTGCTNFMATNGATFYITGVQLEAGTVATSFDWRPYGTELALCQRYLPCFNANISFNGTAAPVGSTFSASSTVATVVYKLPVTTRVPPTGVSVSSNSHFTLNQSGVGYAPTITMGFGGIDASTLTVTVASGLTSGAGGYLYATNSAGQIQFTGCEL